MFRTISVLTILTWASGATATTTFSRQAAPVEKWLPPESQPRLLTSAKPGPTYQITPDTEVLLDDRPTDYDKVPAGARVVSMEVTPDNVVLRIEFRSPPPPTPWRPAR